MRAKEMTVAELIEELNKVESKDLPIVVRGKHFNNIEASKVDVGVERFVIKESGTVTEMCVNIT